MSSVKNSLLEANGLADKLLLFSLAAGVVGRSVNATVRANKQELIAIKEVLSCTRELQETLHRPGVKLRDILESLQRKKDSAAEFERVTGIQWPL